MELVVLSLEEGTVRENILAHSRLPCPVKDTFLKLKSAVIVANLTFQGEILILCNASQFQEAGTTSTNIGNESTGMLLRNDKHYIPSKSIPAS